MKNDNSNDNLDVMLSFVLWAAFAVGLATATTGCSFGFEIGYHGRTGLDNRTQTQLIANQESGAARSAKDRY